MREDQAVSPHCIFLTISTAGTTPTGSSTLTITGTGGGNLTHTATVALVVTPVSGTPVFQINSGGPAVAPFAADAFFSGGQTASTTAAIDTSGVTNPAPTAVYQTERWGGDAAFHPAPFSYTFSNLTAGASYTVRLHFAEIFWTAAGQRKFNVAINGTSADELRYHRGGRRSQQGDCAGVHDDGHQHGNDWHFVHRGYGGCSQDQRYRDHPGNASSTRLHN